MPESMNTMILQLKNSSPQFELIWNTAPLTMESLSVKTASKESSHNNITLPASFKPSPYTVIVGRGKDCKSAPGNLKLREIATNFLTQYCKARGKNEKSEILTEIVQMVRDTCPNGGAFVKKGADGCWIELDDHGAREKVGYVLRDLLHDKYRSSSRSKTSRRRARQHEQKIMQSKKERSCGYDSSSSSSSSSSTNGDDEMSNSHFGSSSREMDRVRPRLHFGTFAFGDEFFSSRNSDMASKPDVHSSGGSMITTGSTECRHETRTLPADFKLPQPIPFRPSNPSQLEKISHQHKVVQSASNHADLKHTEDNRRQSLTSLLSDERFFELDDINDCDLSDEDISSEIFD